MKHLEIRTQFLSKEIHAIIHSKAETKMGREQIFM